MRTGALSASASLVAIAAQRRFGGALEKATAEGFSVQSFTDAGTPKKALLITSSTTVSIHENGTFRVMIVSGGASGARSNSGSGGGAGRYLNLSSVALTKGDATVVVGAGGALAASGDNPGNSGGTSSWNGAGLVRTLPGGGFGAASSGNGGNGGSGGGCTFGFTAGVATGPDGVGYGGAAATAANGGGAGGGAGGPGVPGASSSTGGPGVGVNILGSPATIGRGGTGKVAFEGKTITYGDGADSAVFGPAAGGPGLVYLEWDA